MYRAGVFVSSLLNYVEGVTPVHGFGGFELNAFFRALYTWPDPHALFEFAAYLIGYRVYVRARARQGDAISEPHRFRILAGAAVGALLLSKGMGLGDAILAGEPFSLGALLRSKSIVGGLLGGLLGVELTKKFLGVRRSSGDLFCFPLMLGMMIGRVGCFLSGLRDGTYGLPSSLPWAIDFGDGIPRHPTALYDIAFLLILGILLSRVRLPEGGRFALFLTAYLAYRFGVEFLKPAPVTAGGLTFLQWSCLTGLAYYAVYWIRRIPNERMSR